MAQGARHSRLQAPYTFIGIGTLHDCLVVVENGNMQCALLLVDALQKKKWLRPMLRKADLQGWTVLPIAAREGTFRVSSHPTTLHHITAAASFYMQHVDIGIESLHELPTVPGQPARTPTLRHRCSDDHGPFSGCMCDVLAAGMLKLIQLLVEVESAPLDDVHQVLCVEFRPWDG